MATYHFNISVPSTVKIGQTCRIGIPTTSLIPINTINRLVLTPSNTSIYPEIKSDRVQLNASGGGFSVTNSQYMLFTFTELGTYTIFIEYASGADTWMAEAVITCASWASNIDAPISDITKQTTEISRLRTSIKRNSGNSVF